MSEPIWNKFLTERDKAVFGASGYGARGGFGKRPALLIIDVNYAFCDERPLPIRAPDVPLADDDGSDVGTGNAWKGHACQRRTSSALEVKSGLLCGLWCPRIWISRSTPWC